MRKTEKPDLRAMREKTLDELEGVVWGPPNHDSYLVLTCHRLRTKPIGQFDVEDLRIMIGQDIGLPYLLPLALDHLEENPWAEGHMYPGDLLKASAGAEFDWATREGIRERFRDILHRAIAEIPRLPLWEEDGMSSVDVPDAELAAKLGVKFRAALERLER
jgi:hypothetical protein